MRPLQRRTNYYSPTVQDPSVVVPDTVGVILERSGFTEASMRAWGFAVAKNLGHNSLEDDSAGLIFAETL